MTMVCVRCSKRWWERGNFPKACPYCSSSRIRPVTSLSEEVVR